MTVLRLLSISLLFVFIAFGTIGGCGGSDSNLLFDNSEVLVCNFTLEGVSNGSSAATATSLWSCSSDIAGFFGFQIFLNFTGFSTDVGNFTWFFVSNCIIQITSAAGVAQIVDIQQSGDVLSFLQVSDVPGLNGIDSLCVRLF